MRKVVKFMTGLDITTRHGKQEWLKLRRTLLICLSTLVILLIFQEQFLALLFPDYPR